MGPGCYADLDHFVLCLGKQRQGGNGGGGQCMTEKMALIQGNLSRKTKDRNVPRRQRMALDGFYACKDATRIRPGSKAYPLKGRKATQGELSCNPLPLA